MVKKNREWSKQEIISVCGIAISTVLMIMTLITFAKTKRAVEISETNLSDSRKKDSIAYIRNKLSDSLAYVQFKSNRTKDSITLDLLKQSVVGQEKTLKETHDNFEKENRPYISIIGVRLDSSKTKIDKKTKYFVSLIIKNYGKTPGYMTKINTGVIYSESENIGNKLHYTRKGDLNFISPPNMEIPILPINGNINVENIKDLKNGMFMYVYGEFTYTDVFKNHIYKSSCCFRCSVKNNLFATDYFTHPYNKVETIK